MINAMRPLESKVSLVTGASRGIGKGIAVGLGEAGATVYLTGRSSAKEPSRQGGTIDETAAEVTRRGGRGIPVRCDHMSDAEVEAVFARIRNDAGRLDILVNNATGLPEPNVLWGSEPFWDVPISIWDDLIDVGLRSHYVAAWFAARMMIEVGSGLIVNVSSKAATTKMGVVPYSVGKAAVDRMTADMAVELRPYRVAIVSVWPPPTRTEAQAEGTSPLFTGRVIAALAADPDVIARTGQALRVAALAGEFQIQDPGPTGKP
jgi:dehydrogenase/reductase SDR family member 1